ncbi:MAG: DNA-protecting protein DprA [Rhodospirillales bacterium]|nr:DNA-protecting protein DprA [Rhodospirillales bacterium]
MTLGLPLALSQDNDGPAFAPISPQLELGAYEEIWLQKGMTFKRMAEKLEADPLAMPSDFVEPSKAMRRFKEVIYTLAKQGVRRFGTRIHHAGEYPAKLRDAKYPVELLYYRGIWELSELPSVAIVGSRRPSEEGKQRAAKLAKMFVAHDYVVVSGLATGIDSAVHRAALDSGGQTIAVIGTPIGEIYPKENAGLQEHIAENHLLISQVPVLRYGQQDYRSNRVFFPERNATMSALTEATIIVEAADTSGTLTQARAAVHQGRKLFILNSCFERADIKWPVEYEEKGAIRVRDPEDIWRHL